jgi:hypothetical protein
MPEAESKRPAAMKLKIVFEVVFMSNIPNSSFEPPSLDLALYRLDERLTEKEKCSSNAK